MITNVIRWVFIADMIMPTMVIGYLDKDKFVVIYPWCRYSSNDCFASKQEAIDSRVSQLISYKKQLNQEAIQ